MKYILLLLLVGFGTVCDAQQVNLKLKVFDSYGKPMPLTDVHFIETETRELVTVKTNTQGALVVALKKGKLWQINVKQIVDNHLWQVVIPQIPGAVSSQTREITYNYPKWLRENRPRVDRKMLDLQVETVKNENKAPMRGYGQVRLVFRKNDKGALSQYPVALTCFKTLKTYTLLTNQNGEAFFNVPIGQEYQIDVGDFMDFSYADLPDKSGMVLEKTLTFEPCGISETAEADTLSQDLKGVPSPCTGRSLLTLMVYLPGEQPYAHAIVQLRQVETGKVYQAKTDEAGKLLLALPMGYRYEYWAGADDIMAQKTQVADLTRAFGKSTVNKSITIMPQKRKRNTKVKLYQAEKDSLIYRHFAHNKVKVANMRKPLGEMQVGSYVIYVDSSNGVGIASGLLMTTGTVQEAIGPNDVTCASYSRDWRPCSEKDLDLMKPSPQGNFFDACILELDVIPQTNKLVLEYVLGSEEYEEYLDFDDSFGMFFGEKGGDTLPMISMIDGKRGKVSVSSINHKANPLMYRSNDNIGKPMFQTWQYDGFTQKMVTKVDVVKGKAYTLKLIIADYHDSIYDTGAFVDFRCE